MPARRLKAVLVALLCLAAGFGLFAASAVGGRGHQQRTTSGRVVVLCYHAIAEVQDPVIGRYSVPPTRFAEQLDVLASRGWTFVDLDTVLAAQRGEGEVPERAVLVTFDDAYEDLLDAASPILEQRGIPAVAFAVAGNIGGLNEWDCNHGHAEMPLLDAEGLRALADYGVEVGSHSRTHRPLTELPAGELKEELLDSALELERLGLPRPRAFAYPYGDWDESVAAAVEAAGYELGFAVDRGVVDHEADRRVLPRVAVHEDDTGSRLHLKLELLDLPQPVKAVARAFDRLVRRA